MIAQYYPAVSYTSANLEFFQKRRAEQAYHIHSCSIKRAIGSIRNEFIDDATHPCTQLRPLRPDRVDIDANARVRL